MLNTEHRTMIDNMIKSASAGNLTEVVDIASNLSSDYVTMNSLMTETQGISTRLTQENEMLVKANSKLFLAQGSLEPSINTDGSTKPLTTGEPTKPVVTPMPYSALFNEKGGFN